MGRGRTGFVVKRKGKFYVRISYTDQQTGRRRELMRRCPDRQQAEQLRKELCKQLASENFEQSIQVERLTFVQLAEKYSTARLIPAQYIGDRKVAGLRSVDDSIRRLGYLTAHFGKARVKAITYNAVDSYRLKRLNQGLSISSVNKELSILRAAFNFAKREGLIDRSPFESGAPLIHLADENRRDRVMTPDEESRLLAVCVDKRTHLRQLLIAAVDTGMRRGEILSLRWSDVDLSNRVINLRAFNTKTIRSRSVPVSDRLAVEMESLQRDGSADGLVFPFGDIKRSWTTACRLARVEGLRFHDLRHTCATRLISAGMPIDEVAKILGHTQINTTFRHYLNTTQDTLDRARAALNSINARERETQQ